MTVAGKELTALVDALASNDPERIRARSTTFAPVGTSSMEARKERHRAQLEALADQLRSMKSERSCSGLLRAC